MRLEKIKELKSKTGIGYGKCKEALSINNNNIEESIRWLQQNGVIRRERDVHDKKAQGYIATYIHHNGRLATLVEVTCQTDFLARADSFRSLANELAIHIAGAKPINLRPTESDYVPLRKTMIDEWIKVSIIEGKPEHIAEKIAAGKWDRWTKENILEKQILITREDKSTVEEALSILCQASGEVVTIERFLRIEIGV